MMNAQTTNDKQRILVAYASGSGSTGEVAAAIVKTLCQMGECAEVKKIQDITTLDNYAAVILGSPIRYDRWMPEATNFVQANQHILKEIPVAYFFTCLTLAKRNAKTEQKAMVYAQKLSMLATEVSPITIGRFGGVLNFSKLPFYFRPAFKGLSLVTGLNEGDYRDWNEIGQWAEEVYSKLTKKNNLKIHT